MTDTRLVVVATGRQGPPGAIGLGSTATWEPDRDYLEAEAVLYQDRFYIALLPSINIVPGTDATRWQVLPLETPNDAQARVDTHVAANPAHSANHVAVAPGAGVTSLDVQAAITEITGFITSQEAGDSAAIAAERAARIDGDVASRDRANHTGTQVGTTVTIAPAGLVVVTGANPTTQSAIAQLDAQAAANAGAILLKADDSAVLHKGGAAETVTKPVHFTGAVDLSTYTSKVGPWIVTHPTWGAVGDGATDATAAIQAAMDDCWTAGGGDVIVPAGTFIVHSVASGGVCLRARPNVTLRGLGPVSVIKRKDHDPAGDSRMIATPGFSTAGYTTPLQYFTVKDLCLDGNQANNATNLITGRSNADHFHSIFLSGAIDCTVQRVLFVNSPGDHLYMHGGATQPCYRTKILNNTFSNSTRVPINTHGCCDSLIDGNLVTNQLQNWAIKMEFDTGNQARWGNIFTNNVIEGCSGISISGRPTAVPINANVAVGDTTFALLLDTAYSDGVVDGVTANFESDSAVWVASDVGRTIVGDNIPLGTTIIARIDSANVTLSNVVQPNDDGSLTSFYVVSRSSTKPPITGQPVTIDNEQVIVQSVNSAVVPYVVTTQRPFQQAHTAGAFARLGYATDMVIADNIFKLTGPGGIGVQLAGMQKTKVHHNSIIGGTSQSIFMTRDCQNVEITDNSVSNLTPPPSGAVGSIHIGGGTTTADVWKLIHTGTLTGGTWVIIIDGQPTAPLAWNATLAQIDAAVEALTQIGAPNTSTTGAASIDIATSTKIVGDPANPGPVSITFTQPRSNVAWTRAVSIDYSLLVGGTVAATRSSTSGVMGGIDDIRVERNEILGAPQYGVMLTKTAGEIHYPSRVKIRNNTIQSAQLGGILVSGSDDLEITGNVIADCGGTGLHAGLRFANAHCNRPVVGFNEFDGSANQTIGILVDSPNIIIDATIRPNNFSGVATPISNPTNLAGVSKIWPQHLVNGSGALAVVIGTIDFPSNVTVQGTLAATGTASAADPTLSTHLATKNYTDSATQAGVPVLGYDGPLSVYTGQRRWTAETNLTITAIRATVGTAPTGAAIVLDVKKNGVSIYTTTANRPTIAISAFTTLATLPDVLTLVSGDYLTVDILTVGSVIAGADLTVQIHVRKT